MRSPHNNLTPCLRGAALAGIFFLSLAAHAEKVKQLKAQGYVNDFAGVLNPQTQAKITDLCKEVDEKTHAQIAVVTIKTLEGLEAANFAGLLFKQWGVGHKDDRRGVLILLAAGDHKYWTEVGYGLEPILPDGKVGGFGREMIPRLRAGEFNGAILHMTYEVAGVIAAEKHVTLSNTEAIPAPVAAPPAAPPEESPSALDPQSARKFYALLIFVGLFLVAAYWAFKAFITFFLASFQWMFGGASRRSRGLTGLWWDALCASWLPTILMMISSQSDGGSGGFGGGSSGGGSFGGFGGGSSGGGGAGGSW